MDLQQTEQLLNIAAVIGGSVASLGVTLVTAMSWYTKKAVKECIDHQAAGFQELKSYIDVNFAEVRGKLDHHDYIFETWSEKFSAQIKSTERVHKRIDEVEAKAEEIKKELAHLPERFVTRHEWALVSDVKQVKVSLEEIMKRGA